MEGQELSRLLRRYLAGADEGYAAVARRAWVDCAYVYRLAKGTKCHPGRDVVIRLGIGLGLTVPDLDELLMAAGYAPLVRPGRPQGRPEGPHDEEAVRGIERGEELDSRKLSARTISDYVKAACDFLKWARAEYGIKDARMATAEMACEYLAGKHDQAGGGLGRIACALRKASLGWLGEKWDLSQGWHSDRRPENAYTTEDIAKLHGALGDARSGDPQRADHFQVMHSSGLRSREAAYLRGDAIDLERCEIRLEHGDKAKGGRPRTVRFAPEYREFYARLKSIAEDHRDGHVFQGRSGLAKRTRDALRYYCSRLDIPPERHGNHAARGYWANQVYQDEVRQGHVRPLPLRELDGDEKRWLRENISEPLGPGRVSVLKSYIEGL